MTIDNILTFLQSKMMRVAVVALFGLSLVIGAFGMGIFVGYHKAEFSHAWSDNYHKNFGQNFIESDGTFGQVVKVDPMSVIVSGRDGAEKTILISEETTIRRLMQTVHLSDLQVGDRIAVIGMPTKLGQIQAQFVRVFPAPTISPQSSL